MRQYMKQDGWIGRRLKHERELAVNDAGSQMRQVDLADAINRLTFPPGSVSQQTVGKWEREVIIPTARYIVAVAKILDVSTDYLTGKSDSRNVFLESDLDAHQMELLSAFETGDLEKAIKLFMNRRG